MVSIQKAVRMPGFTILYSGEASCTLEIESRDKDYPETITAVIDKKEAEYIAEELRQFIKASNRAAAEEE